ncbi:MAG: archease [Acidobacteriota bacterium]|nr:archease [Acidobacteriota bacterium]
MKPPQQGHREVEHTADLKLEVWGPDMAAVLEEAARGMYELMAVEVSEDSRRHHQMEVQADDREQLMVSFLEELLYLADSEELAFDGFLLKVDDTQLVAHLEGGFMITRSRDIKAVTFHSLRIGKSGSGLRTHVVFDV